VWHSSTSGIIGSSDPVTTIADEIIRSGIGSGEAGTFSEADISLDEEEEDDDVYTTQSIEQASTRSSSDPPAGGTTATTLWAGVGADDEAWTTFAFFATGTNDGSVLVAFLCLAFILSTLAFIVPWAPYRPAVTTFITPAPLTVLKATGGTDFGTIIFWAAAFDIAFGEGVQIQLSN
jgi:hypothetical protein